MHGLGNSIETWPPFSLCAGSFGPDRPQSLDLPSEPEAIVYSVFDVLYQFVGGLVAGPLLVQLQSYFKREFDVMHVVFTTSM